MKKGLKIFLFIVLGLVVLIGAGIIIKTDYEVERSIVIDAPKTDVADNVKSYKIRQEWSPWRKYDTNMKVTFEGTDGEVGSKSMWEGNEDVGKGYQELVAVSDDKIEEKVVFIEPWEGQSPSVFTFEEVENGTKVTWGFKGESPMILVLFMDMDKMIGDMYDDGLKDLKTLTETGKIVP